MCTYEKYGVPLNQAQYFGITKDGNACLFKADRNILWCIPRVCGYDLSTSSSRWSSCSSYGSRLVAPSPLSDAAPSSPLALSSIHSSWLRWGTFLVSPEGRFSLGFRASDNKLVLHDIWKNIVMAIFVNATGYMTTPPEYIDPLSKAQLHMLANGNLCAYSHPSVRYHFCTYEHYGVELDQAKTFQIYDNIYNQGGDVCLLDADDKIVWCLRTKHSLQGLANPVPVSRPTAWINSVDGTLDLIEPHQATTNTNGINIVFYAIVVPVAVLVLLIASVLVVRRIRASKRTCTAVTTIRMVDPNTDDNYTPNPALQLARAPANHPASIQVVVA